MSAGGGASRRWTLATSVGKSLILHSLAVTVILILMCAVSGPAAIPTQAHDNIGHEDHPQDAIAAPLAWCVRTDLGLAHINGFRELGGKELARRLQSDLPEGLLAKRDTAFVELGKVMSANAGNTGIECLIGEHLSIGTSGNPGRYERMILWSSAQPEEALKSSFKPLGGIWVTADTWAMLDAVASQLLRQGDSANDCESSAFDVLLVHYYDGKEWKRGQYFNFEDLQTAYQGRAGRTGALIFMLLHLVNQGISAESGFMENRYCSYLDQMKREMLQDNKHTSAHRSSVSVRPGTGPDVCPEDGGH